MSISPSKGTVLIKPERSLWLSPLTLSSTPGQLLTRLLLEVTKTAHRRNESQSSPNERSTAFPCNPLTPGVGLRSLLEKQKDTMAWHDNVSDSQASDCIPRTAKEVKRGGAGAELTGLREPRLWRETPSQQCEAENNGRRQPVPGQAHALACVHTRARE